MFATGWSQITRVKDSHLLIVHCLWSNTRSEYGTVFEVQLSVLIGFDRVVFMDGSFAFQINKVLYFYNSFLILVPTN
jgi:hypothetical protein